MTHADAVGELHFPYFETQNDLRNSLSKVKSSVMRYRYFIAVSPSYVSIKREIQKLCRDNYARRLPVYIHIHTDIYLVLPRITTDTTNIIFFAHFQANSLFLSKIVLLLR